MEPDKNTNGFITDEMRLRAETKQVTIDPLHQDVKANELPDSEIVAHHLTAGPLANSPNDTEQTTGSQSASTAEITSSVHPRSGAIIAGALAVCGLSTVALIFFTS